MMSRMFGAPLGGTTCGGHQGLDWSAWRLMVPPKCGGGGGRYRPSIVVVALGAPGAPVVCWAPAECHPRNTKARAQSTTSRVFELLAPMLASYCLRVPRGRPEQLAKGPRLSRRSLLDGHSPAG